MARKVAILVEDYFDERELIYPYFRFMEAGYDVELIGPEKKEYHGKSTFTIHADKGVDEVKPEEYVALFIPGGYAPDRLRRHDSILNFVKTMNEKGKVIGAVCHAPWVLISAGIIKNRKVTGFYAIKDDIVNAGAVYTGSKVEVDGNLITGTDPSALPEMLVKMLELLK
ncbi:MAG: type 1 glutamine amidotransferase [Thermoproteales archaeon]|nr:type 1 glutamine amidotransferase [Thermoproteales archaeon]